MCVRVTMATAEPLRRMQTSAGSVVPGQDGKFHFGNGEFKMMAGLEISS